MPSMFTLCSENDGSGQDVNDRRSTGYRRNSLRPILVPVWAAGMRRDALSSPFSKLLSPVEDRLRGRAIGDLVRVGVERHQPELSLLPPCVEGKEVQARDPLLLTERRNASMRIAERIVFIERVQQREDHQPELRPAFSRPPMHVPEHRHFPL